MRPFRRSRSVARACRTKCWSFRAWRRLRRSEDALTAVTTASRINVLKHPAFAGFARLLLPWDDRRYDGTMRLSEIGSLLPYHTHVDPAVIVSSLNRMIDDAAAGKTVFHDFYTEAQKRRSRRVRHTGLFFFRGQTRRAVRVIAPGGGFLTSASVHEGFPVRRRDQQPRLQRIRAEIPRRAWRRNRDRGSGGGTLLHLSECRRLGVATAGYSLWGSSAGARMAASIGSHGAATVWRIRSGEAIGPRPSLYRSFGSRLIGTADVRCRRRRRWNRAAPMRWNDGLRRCEGRHRR